MRKRRRVLLAALLSAACRAAPAPAEPFALAGVDVYRSDRLTADDVRRRYAEQLRALIDRKNRSGRSKPAGKQAEDIRERIEKDAKSVWRLAWARLALTESSGSDGPSIYATLDVLDEKDQKTRAPFRPRPAGKFVDSQGLLALWSEYSDLGWRLVRTGRMTLDRVPCRAFFCPWGALTPEMKAMDDRFAEAVPANEKWLVSVLNEDADARRRANAVYLLAYAGNGNQLVHRLTIALRDPDMDVRTAALRVLGDLAVYHGGVYLPIEQITEALDYPNTEERGKALAVLVGLADNAYYRPYLIRNATGTLLALLRLRQPTNHDLAHVVLGLLSKRNIAATDYAGWERWAEQARAELPGAPAPPAEPASDPK